MKLNKKTAFLVITAMIATCGTIGRANATETDMVHFTGKLHVGRIKAAQNSTLRLSSMKLRGSTLGSSLRLNTRAKIGGPVTLNKGARLQVAAMSMDNGRIGGSANLQMNVQMQQGVTAGQNSDIGIGGVQISADENYVPGQFVQSSSFTGMTGSGNGIPGHVSNGLLLPDSRQRLLVPAMQHQHAGQLVFEKGKTVAPVDRYLVFAEMSKVVYGKAEGNILPGWDKIWDTNYALTEADRKMKKNSGRAVAYRNAETHEIVIVFEGTQSPAKAVKSLKNTKNLADDILEDTTQMIIPTFQYEAAEKIVDNLWKKYGKNNKIVVTGHSLGGGLAQWSGANLAIKHPGAKVEGVVFNSADLGVKADNYLLANQDHLSNMTMTHIRVNGDSVSGTSGRYDMGNVFPKYTEYELPTNTSGFLHGIGSDHGIDVVVEKMKEHHDNFATYRHEDQLKRKIADSWLAIKNR